MVRSGSNYDVLWGYVKTWKKVRKITKDFGIKTLRIFGSVSRNEQTEQSDLDVCVETETPNPFLLADLKEFLEDLFKCSVDVVRIHKNMNPFFKSRIERDGIYAIR